LQIKILGKFASTDRSSDMTEQRGGEKFMNKPILVTGATGTIGRDVANDFPKKARRCEDAASFSDALDGVEKIFLLPPLLPNQVEVTNAFVDAAKHAGVRHIVKLSAIGADSDAAFAFGKWHGAGEQYIRESGLAFTFFRPNSFMQNFITYFPPRGGAIYLPWGNGKASFVDTRDIAAVAAQVLTTDAHEGKTYTLTGPAAHGIEELAQILSEASGSNIRYQDVPESAARDGMLEAGLPQWQVDALMELHAINKQSRWSAVTSDIENVTGKPAIEFTQFACNHAEKFRPK
jgi:uncharacterized protein YbjT (DUF2867 family)